MKVRRGSEVIALELLAALPLVDRCAFRGPGMWQAVPGVRSASTLVVGESVYAYGFARGSPSFSGGMFLGFDTLDRERVIETTAYSDHGCSGGALFDRFGNLIGIIAAGTGDHAISYALITDDWWS